MKQFVADRHTTPGTAALEPVNIPKVPVYDTQADVTADLANLTVGQIVATKDTGTELSQPVDVVEEDNLHAVTSNAVAESLSVGAMENITLSSTETTIQKDGVLYISASRSNTLGNSARVMLITINGFDLDFYFNAFLNNDWGASAIIPVFAGDIIKVTSTQNISARIRYYNR